MTGLKAVTKTNFELRIKIVGQTKKDCVSILESIQGEIPLYLQDGMNEGNGIFVSASDKDVSYTFEFEETIDADVYGNPIEDDKG